MTTDTNRPPLLSIALVSGVTLAYEILLMRLFSIVQWHHFAYMIISLALLGFGASGTLLTLAGRRFAHRFRVVYALNAVLFGFSTVMCFLLAQRVPFNALEFFWDRRQPLWLLLLYLLLLTPFFFAANCIGLAFIRFRDRIPSIYSADLLGAGAGSVGVILLLFVVSVEQTLLILGALAMGAAALAWFGPGRRPLAGAGVLLAAVVFTAPSSWTTLRLSEYKGLSQALNVAGTVVAETRSGPLGLLTTVHNERIPFRHVPGLSLNATVEPLPQVAVFTDGEGPSVITRYAGDRDSLAYLDDTTSALPYHLLNSPRTLILGAGGGSDILQALYHDAARIDAVELNRQMVALAREDYGDFSGHLFDMDRVHVWIDEGRGFVARANRRFDLIQVALLDSFSASSAGLYALSESHLYTVEALQQFLRRLNPAGLLAITRWVKLPPRDGIKLFATAIAALERSGLARPEARLVWIRGWNTSTVLAKNGAFTQAEIDVVRAFCESRSFDLAFYPGMTAAEANRFNQLDRPYFFESAGALLGDNRDAFLERYKFALAPATDDRPYFSNFFKWSALPEIVNLMRHGGVALLDLGYPILIATLVQALAASAVLILLPLWLRRRRTGQVSRRTVRSRRVFFYFAALGLGFMFVEIAFIQKFILFLSYPLYAVAVVLAAFLVFAGLGSRYATGANIALPIAVICALGIVYLLGLPALFARLMGWPDPLKIALSIVLIAPLAFSMGIPFPRGLERLDSVANELVPWAWGINGCASVVSAVLATVLAIHLGFSAVLLIAVLLYALAGLFGPQTFAPRAAQ